MNTALSLRGEPEHLPSQEIAHTITSALDGLKAIRTFVQNEFVEGVDYGKIPGCGDKPALLNPGAQKAVMYFNSYPTFKVKEKDLGAGHVDFRVRAILVSRVTLHQVGEGIGCASTKEKKFRRSAGSDMKKCPQCGKAAVLKSKEKPEFFCWRKKDGCGAVFALNHPAMKAPATPAEDNDAPYEVRNTVLKMAKKRALVDAAMTLGCLAELFTQDIEDTYAANEVREAARPYDGEVVAEFRPIAEHKPEPPQKSAPGLFTKEHVKVTEKFNAWVANECGRVNHLWRDEWDDRVTTALEEGFPVPEKIDDLVNQWQAKAHLMKWAIETGRLAADIKVEASKTRQTDAYVAWVAAQSDEGKAAIKAEMGEYIEKQRQLKSAAIYGKHPELAPEGFAEEQAEAKAKAKATAIANQAFDKVHDRHGEPECPEDRGDAYEGE